LTECLSGEYELREFRPDLITELLDEYLTPNKMRLVSICIVPSGYINDYYSRVFLVSKDFQSLATEQEKWFGTQYKEEYLPNELIDRCVKCELTSELHLPKPNEFIPTDFRLLSDEKHLLRPQSPVKIKVRL
jgi:insulysin